MTLLEEHLVSTLSFLRIALVILTYQGWDQISEMYNSKVWVLGSSPISYDAPRRRMRLGVRTPYHGDIIASVTRHLRAAQDSKVPVLLGNTREHRLISDEQHYDYFHPPVTTYKRNSDSVYIFPIRKIEDSIYVKLWNEFIIPALPRILDEPMKTGYTACLVRRGTTLDRATPVIRIESPHPPGELTKEKILAKIEEAYVTPVQSVKIRVQFCTGSIVHLSGEIEEDEESCGERGNYLFPFVHNTYWKHAGMGASIGLLCTNTEFATLGCYLNVDGENFILTVDHFIQKSYESLDKDREGDLNTLTSPAIAKVRSIKTYLENIVSAWTADLDANMEAINHHRLVNSADLKTLEFESVCQLAKNIELLDMLLKEHQKKDIEYTIGSLSYRCEPGSVAPLSRSHSTMKQDHQFFDGIEPGVRLDWAVFAVKSASSRQGRNQYRQDRVENGRTNLFLDQASIGKGRGEVCHRTCVVEGNEQVRFVGGHNGSLEGQVNGTLQVVRHEDRTTLEHHIVMCPDNNRSVTEHEGSSGTMVVKVPDNEILGMIWGCNEGSGQPVFTPIHTIFEDIRKVTRADNVTLNQDPEHELSSTSNVRLISGSERDARKLPPPRHSDFPKPLVTSDYRLKVLKNLNMSFPLRPKDHSVNDAPVQNTTIYQSQMRVPSLSSSRASSPGSLPSTPAMKLIEKYSTADCTTGHIPIIGEDTERPLVVDAEDNDAIQQDDSWALRDNNSAIENRPSIQFLVTGGQQKSWENLFSVSPSRWNTWPMETGSRWIGPAEEPTQLVVMAK